MNTANITYSARDGRADRMNEVWSDKVRAACKASRDKLSADLTRIIEDRNAARLRLYNDAKTKFGGGRALRAYRA
jgi:hypothetical protein